MSRVHPPLRLRPMQLSDIDAVMALEHVSFADPWPRSLYEREVKAGRFSRYYIVETDTPDVDPPVMAGQAGYWLLGDEAHIVTIAVDPQWRGRGIGKWLLLNVLAELRQRGAELVTLEVRPSNAAALALYHKLGFQAIGQRKRYYPDGEDAYILELVGLDNADVWQPLAEELAGLDARIARNA
ncbi:MAG: ribosomal protein S18-alanine N-acetyltransferase [Caldilineaceae bacterium]|nr:ribosomal protein S18-alanine N-acetyltransferase [Caldilineaceae bacterium]